jgi:DnaJ-class molecular chaperone
MDFVADFERFLEEKHPDYCMACWGEGRVIFRGIYVKNGDVQCPICKGTGKKEIVQHECK